MGGRGSEMNDSDRRGSRVPPLACDEIWSESKNGSLDSISYKPQPHRSPVNDDYYECSSFRPLDQAAYSDDVSLARLTGVQRATSSAFLAAEMAQAKKRTRITYVASEAVLFCPVGWRRHKHMRRGSHRYSSRRTTGIIPN